MSDDVWAPHEWRFLVHPDTTLGELVQIAVDDHYLAHVAGNRAAWVVEAGPRPATPLAVVAQQWPYPGWLADPTQKLVNVPGAYDPSGPGAELYFRYHGQRDLQELLDELVARTGGVGRGRRLEPSNRHEQPARPQAPW
jgi:hypothetical protein